MLALTLPPYSLPISVYLQRYHPRNPTLGQKEGRPTSILAVPSHSAKVMQGQTEEQRFRWLWAGNGSMAPTYDVAAAPKKHKGGMKGQDYMTAGTGVSANTLGGLVLWLQQAHTHL